MIQVVFSYKILLIQRENTLLTNIDFIVFSDDWGRHPFSCMHLMRRFLNANRILWVNTIGMRYPRLTTYDLKRAAGKICNWVIKETAKPIDIPDNLTIISPPMIPYNNIHLIRNWNCRSVVSATRHAMKDLGFKNPVVLITVPNASDYLGFLDEQIAVYYCVDEFVEWPGVARKLVADMESSLLHKVNLVVAVSDELMRNKKTKLGPTYLLTHGVDVQHFSLACSTERNREIPILKELSGPIIGYFGLFDERSDQELLEHLLFIHPDWNIVILGRSVVDISRLKKYSNFHHYGPVPYDDLPYWASYFDVCIIPYLINKLTLNINPLKLKEYLATGKPVVSTPLPEAVKLSNLIMIGNNPQDFVRQVEFALDNSLDSVKQINSISDEDWGIKAEQFSIWIEQSLAQTKVSP